MKAGFARERITPPLGTRMMGFAGRDRSSGCTSVHDDLYVRVLHASHEGAEVLIASFDLCFLGRADADRLKGALGRTLGLAPAQILLSATHTHGGPSVGTWAYAGYLPPDAMYLDDLETAVLDAAARARRESHDVTVLAGRATSTVPMNRRLRLSDGTIVNRPNPDGDDLLCNSLPIALLQDEQNKPVCLLFSVSCHPSAVNGLEISADYPGIACTRLDEHLGAPASMFLQGAGGDAKTRPAGEGQKAWISGDWDVIASAGRTVAREVLSQLRSNLTPVEPAIRSALVEAPLQLEPPLVAEKIAAMAAEYHPDESPTDQDLRVLWAHRLMERLSRRGALPTTAPILVQAVQLARGLRLIAIEGEPVGLLGRHVEEVWDQGVTFCLGYANGEGLYLPVSQMLAEGGYEVDSFHEYGFPARLAEGAESAIDRAAPLLREQGIE